MPTPRVLKKPKPKALGKVYEYHEIENYIQKKCNIDLRHYKGVDGQNFWHSLNTWNGGIRNGSFISLPFCTSEGTYEGTEPWQTEILNLIYTEFPDLKETNQDIWVEW